MVNQRLLPEFRLTNGDGIERPFREYLAEFNILAIRRVSVPSHGPATKLLLRLLAGNRGAQDVTMRAFDIRSPDRVCETCHGPHIVFTGPKLATICDSDGSILRKFGVVGYDRFFVVRSGSQVLDVGSLEDISRSGLRLALDGDPSRDWIARSPPNRRQTEDASTIFDSRSQPCRPLNQMETA